MNKIKKTVQDTHSKATLRLARKNQELSLYLSNSSTYTNLFYGVMSVFVLFGIFLLVLRFVSPHTASKGEILDKAATTSVKEESTKTDHEYVVQEGDSLWSIAEAKLHDGFSWKKIAEANNITNPGVIEKGMKLAIPEDTTGVQPTITSTGDTKNPPSETASNNRITGESYVIAHGDSLWDIAVRAYGDGYKWTEIAKSNNLPHPGLIHAGNTISIPR